MNRSRPRLGLAYAGIASALRPHAAMGGVAALAATPLLLLSAVVPLGLILPVLSLVFLAVAAVLALVAWRRQAQRASDKITVWDLCGACAFIGFAAAILSKPENILTAFAPVTGG
jgi:hypothetical protein